MSALDHAFLAYRTTRDPAALAAVYDGTSSRLLAVALHLSGSASAAEDAVQDTFLFALEHPERWDATRPLMPWLLGILSNLLKQSAYRSRRAPDPERLALPNVCDPESELQATELLSRIEEAITDLAQPYRAVVLLRLRNGLSPADIAIALDRKPSTVRAQLTRGVEMLRKALPVGVAGLLVGSLAASRGMTAVSDTIMHRAEQLHRALRAQNFTAQCKLWSLRFAGAAAVTLAAWGVASAFAEDVSAAPEVVVSSPEAKVETPKVDIVVREEPLPWDPDVAVVPADREQASVDGDLAITVKRVGVAMPHALVEIEPLTAGTRPIVHYTSSHRGRWREIVSSQPCARSRVRRGTTGADGLCRFGGLAPGPWICRSLGIASMVMVTSAGTKTLDIHCEPDSRLVRGLVLDARGQALPDAPIWVCQEHRAPFRRVVAHTNASGRFSLTVAPFTTVGALHAGSAPVARTVRRAGVSPPLDVVLQMHEPGAMASGRVVDASGRPIASAVVEVGHPHDLGAVPSAKFARVLARPARTKTDAQGRFSFDCLVPGQTWLSVRGAGHGVERQCVQLRAGDETKVEVSLSLAAVVVGRVCDAEGQPVVGASVRTGRRGSLSYRATVTASDGSYRLGDVPAGAPMVEILDYQGGFACQVASCRPGGQVVFDAVLQRRDLLLQGQVLGPTGQPLAHAWVVHHCRLRRSALRLDALGRFSIALSDREAALSSTVEVFAHDPREVRLAGKGLYREPLAVATGLRGGVAAKIQVPDRVHSAWLRGQCSVPASLAGSGRILLRAMDTSLWRQPIELADDGSFAIGPLAAGRYLIDVPGHQHLLGPFELGIGQVRDLGMLEGLGDGAQKSARHNRHVAALFPTGYSMAESLRVEVRDQQGNLVVLRSHPGDLTESGFYVSLPEGEFVIRIATPSGLLGERELVVDRSVPPSRAVLVVLSPS